MPTSKYSDRGDRIKDGDVTRVHIAEYQSTQKPNHAVELEAARAKTNIIPVKETKVRKGSSPVVTPISPPE
jgi:hypothetical protein